MFLLSFTISRTFSLVLLSLQSTLKNFLPHHNWKLSRYLFSFLLFNGTAHAAWLVCSTLWYNLRFLEVIYDFTSIDLVRFHYVLCTDYEGSTELLTMCMAINCLTIEFQNILIFDTVIKKKNFCLLMMRDHQYKVFFSFWYKNRTSSLSRANLYYYRIRGKRFCIAKIKINYLLSCTSCLMRNVHCVRFFFCSFYSADVY